MIIIHQCIIFPFQYPFHFDGNEDETTPVHPTKEKKRQLTPFHRVRASAAPVPANRALQFRERMKVSY